MRYLRFGAFFVATAIAPLLVSATAHATAGAPDPSFGVRGVAKLPADRSTVRSEENVGDALVLSTGDVVVPIYRMEYKIKNGEPVDVLRTTLSFARLRSNGSVARRSAPADLPRWIERAQVVPTSSGHLIVVGLETSVRGGTPVVHVLRLSVEGVPAAAGGSSSLVSIPLRSVPKLGSNPRDTMLQDVAVGPSGRVFVALR